MPGPFQNDASLQGVDRSEAEVEASTWIELAIYKGTCSVSHADDVLYLDPYGAPDSKLQ